MCTPQIGMVALNAANWAKNAWAGLQTAGAAAGAAKSAGVLSTAAKVAPSLLSAAGTAATAIAAAKASRTSATTASGYDLSSLYNNNTTTQVEKTASTLNNNDPISSATGLTKSTLASLKVPVLNTGNTGANTNSNRYIGLNLGG